MAVITVGQKIREFKTFVDEEMVKELRKPEEPSLSKTVLGLRFINVAIINAENAWEYAGMMTQDVAKVDGTFTKRLENLEQMIAKYKAKENVDFSALASTLLTDLSMHRWQPKLTALSPAVVMSATNCFQVTIYGEFKYSVNGRFSPSLKIGATEYSPSKKEYSRLVFNIETFDGEFPFAAATMKKGTLGQVALLVPYDIGRLTSSISTAIFNIWLAAVPKSPGTLEVQHIRQEVVDLKSQHFISPTLTLTADEKIISTEKRVTIYPTEGWRINHKTVHLRKGPEAMEQSWYTNGGVVDNYVTISMLSVLGKTISCYVEFDETQEVLESKTQIETLTPRWGEEVKIEKIFDEQIKYLFRPFDGKELAIDYQDCEKSSEIGTYFKIITRGKQKYFVFEQSTSFS